MKLIKIMNDIPIKKKFISVYIFCVLIPMVLVYGIFFVKIRGEVALREEIAISEAIDRVTREVNTTINSSQAIARDIVIDPTINELIDLTFESTADYYRLYYNDLRDKIERYASAYNNVIRVSVYTDNPSLITGGNVYFINDAIQSSPWYQEFIRGNQVEKLIGWEEPNPLVFGGTHKRLSLFRKMNSFNQFSVYNKIVRIDIEIGRVESSLKSEYLLEFTLNNHQGIAQVTSFSEEEGPTMSMARHVVPIKAGELSDWQLVAYVPRSNLGREITRSAGLVIILFLISLTLSLLMIYLFSHSYNSRIRVLQSHMIKVQNSEFELIDDPMGKDEIGYLIHSFNNMTKQINELINEILKFELREKEHQLENVKAELRFLQSQMDPHFLFNTLNAILVVANQNNYTEITDIIKYLSKTLRHLIEWRDVMVDIYDEVNFTKMYLEIEKFRFRDKFEFDLEVEEGLTDVYIPKMTIQPFIENACKHGIQASKKIGKVSLRIFSMQNRVHIIIKDNGVGMTKERIDEILNDNIVGHIGIQNVIMRLKLHYNEQYRFQIQSQINQGTTVLIEIPLRVENFVKEVKGNES